MNKLFALNFIVACFVSCSNEIVTPNVDQNDMATRAIVLEGSTSITNPNLLYNWENVEEIVSNVAGENFTAPWVDGASTYLSTTFRKDIKKEDGWEMLFHTFKKIGLDSDQNYMCFYNRFTGYIKVFYFYNSHSNSQNTHWSIMTSGLQNIKMLDTPTYYTRPLSDAAVNNKLIVSNMTQNQAAGIEYGWNGFEFQIPRYSDDLKDMDFIIGAYDNVITTHSLWGSFNSSTTGTITTTSSGSSNLTNYLAKIAGGEAKSYINSLAAGTFKEKVIVGKKIKDLIGTISKSGYAAVFKEGLNLIFGKTTTTTTSDVKLTTTGAVKMEGTSSKISTTGVAPVPVNLYETLNSTNNKNSNVVQKNNTGTTDRQFGVWTLKKNPVVYYNRVSHLFNVKRDDTYTSSTKVKITGDTYLPEFRYEYEPIINPDVEPYITKKDFSVQFVVCDKMDGKAYNDNMNDINDNLGKEILFSDSDRCICSTYETGKLKHFDIIVPKLKNNMLGTYYYDWGNVTNGRLLAVVTLDMTYNYNGAQKEVSSSQVYEVDYGVDETQLQPESVQNLPNSAVINYGYPFYTEYKNVDATNEVNALSDEDEEHLYKLHLLPE